MSHLFDVITRRRLAVLLVFSVLLACLAPAACADPKGPSPNDHRVAVAVTSLLTRQHLNQRPLDKEIIDRTITQFLKMLDPTKSYFYQSDVDQFKGRAADVERQLSKGDISFAYDVYRTLVARVDERVKLAEEYLNQQHDFTVDEDVIVDRDATQYPKNEAEAREKWRKRVKYDLILLKADRLDKSKSKKDEKSAKSDDKSAKSTEPAEEEVVKTPAEQAKDDLDRLHRRYRMVGKRMHQINSYELLEMYLTALTSSFDPHTSYMSPDTVENFEISMRLNLEGIGAALQSIDGYTVVQRIVPQGAAEKDGRLKVGDKIIGVGQGESGPIEDVVEMKLNDVVKMIRGKQGTVVRLEVLKGQGGKKKIVQLTRAKIALEDSAARAKVFEVSSGPGTRPYKIGVLDLPSFYMDMAAARNGDPDYKSTTRDVRKILAQFNRDGVDALVLDLRRNGGGSLQEAIDLTGLFIDLGVVVQVKDPDGRVHPHNDRDAGMAWKGPMVVMISKFSASASEILAGAIQDYHRGLIVGDRSTHGKGTVQSLVDLSEGLFRNPFTEKMGALKLTIQQFYRPDGDSTQRRGVLADVEIPSITTHMDVGEADLDYALPFDRVEPIEHTDYQLVSKAIVEQLRKDSDVRTKASEDFQRTIRKITRYEEQKKRKRMTLNEKKFLEEWAELNADKEDEKKLEELDGSSVEIKRDYYLNEVLAITSDYLKLLVKNPPAANPSAVAPAKSAEVPPKEE
jgi:carboxyl-terminal processing protease